jgi:NAD(P)H-dependent FMN reductase
MRALTDAVIAGASDDQITGVEVVVREALRADAGDVLAADGYLLGTPANFGYMSGALKHFFDTIFLRAGGALTEAGGEASQAGGGSKKPSGAWVHGKYDVTGAVRSVQSIVGALPWVPAAGVLEVVGQPGDEHTAAAYELGATLAALLSR